jgi:ferredoxin
VGRLVIRPEVFSGEVPPQRSILQVLLQLRHPILHSCRRGLCGQDLIRVISGWEHLNPIEETEDSTLQLLSAKDQPMRMACCARVVGDGEVVVEIVR